MEGSGKRNLHLHRSMWLPCRNRIKSVTPLPSKFRAARILATHSLDKPVPGLKNLMAETYPRLQRGRMAWLLMQEISQGNREPHVLQAFRELEGDRVTQHVALRYAPDMNHVTAAQYRAAMRGAIPQVAPVF